MVALAYVGTRSQLTGDLDRTLLREVEAYAAAVAPASADDDRDLREVSRGYLEARTVGEAALQPVLLVSFANGGVISNSDVRLEAAEGNSNARDPASAERDIGDVVLDGRRWRVASSPVLDATGTPAAVFQAALPADSVSAVVDELAVSLLLTGLAVSMVGATLSLLVARGALRPLSDMASAAGGVTQRDMTGRLSYDGPEDELGKLVDSLNEMLDRLETAFGEQKRFVADASHELRTPITVMRAALHTLGREDAEEADRAYALQVIDAEAIRMTRLVDDLLALARLEAGEVHAFQDLEVCTLLEEACMRGKALGGSIDCECPPELWVNGDPERLEQALMNLVTNALGHTPEGSHVSLRGAAVDRWGRPFVRIDVLDSGHGIRKGDLPHLFDRFYRAQGPRGAASGGSGLGLAITKRLLELHGGEISVANRPEGGAVFTIDLPRIEAPGS